MIIPTIEFDNQSHWEFIPREIINPDEKWIKHVRCDGTRFHVLSYYLVNGKTKTKCSEPDCIYNKASS